MNSTTQMLHDNIINLAYKVGIEAAVLEINQTRPAAQNPSLMAEATRQAGATWANIMSSMGR